jgi:hypothetical protein
MNWKMLNFLTVTSSRRSGNWEMLDNLGKAKKSPFRVRITFPLISLEKLVARY